MARTLAIEFVVALVPSFTIAMLTLRPSGTGKVTRQRLVTIQDSVRSAKAVAYGDDLGVLGRRSYSDRVGAFLENYRFSKKLRALLVHAGSSMSVGDAVIVSAGCGLGFGLASFFFLHSILPECAAVIAGSAVPVAVLRFKRAKRLKAFNAALPDAIDLMSRSLLAGHSMGSSIELVAEQSPEPLAFEFVQVYQQQRLGLHFRDALLQMGTRIPSRDLQFLITAILVQKETGGDLTEILARASHVIRERVRIEGEVRTHTAQGRLTGWILSLLPIVTLLLINLLSPGYSRILFEDPIGQKLLFAGGSLIAVGGLIIRKIVDVQV
jgi:tight adherence protein B